MRNLRPIIVFAMLSGLDGLALGNTNTVAVLAQRIAGADRIVATNWAASQFEDPAFEISISSDKVRRIVKAVSAATRHGDQEHPDWEYDWKLQFYAGTNFLAAVCFHEDVFLSEGVFRDDTEVLKQAYHDLVNCEYVARVYKDEEKDFAAATKVEARQWLKSPSHSPLREKKPRVIRFVEAFYKAGAGKVLIADIQKQVIGKGEVIENAKTMIVVLPQDSEARRRVFEVVWRAPREWMNDPDRDVGQKYLWYGFE